MFTTVQNAHTQFHKMFTTLENAHSSRKCSQLSGFHTEGGGGGGTGIPPPRNLGIEYGYYCGAINISCLITGHKYVSSKCCLESLSQIASEAIREDLNPKISWGGGHAPRHP